MIITRSVKSNFKLILNRRIPSCKIIRRTYSTIIRTQWTRSYIPTIWFQNRPIKTIIGCTPVLIYIFSAVRLICKRYRFTFTYRRCRRIAINRVCTSWNRNWAQSSKTSTTTILCYYSGLKCIFNSNWSNLITLSTRWSIKNMWNSCIVCRWKNVYWTPISKRNCINSTWNIIR